MATASYRIPYELPNLFGSSLHVGILIPFIIAIVLTLILNKTIWGFELGITGHNKRVAEFVGMQVERNILFVMLLSGAIAGLAGSVHLLGTAHRLSGSISNSYGYLGIIVGALANASPSAVLLTGFLLAILLNAGIILQTQGLSVNSVYAITGLILLFAAIGEIVAQYRISLPYIHPSRSIGTLVGGISGISQSADLEEVQPNEESDSS